MTDKHDDWYPTDTELKKAKPIAQADPKLLAAHKQGKLARGRPPKDDKKVTFSMRVEPELLAKYKSSGKGWQSRARAALWDGLHE